MTVITLISGSVMTDPSLRVCGIEAVDAAAFSVIAAAVTQIGIWSLVTNRVTITTKPRGIPWSESRKTALHGPVVHTTTDGQSQSDVF